MCQAFPAEQLLVVPDSSLRSRTPQAAKHALTLMTQVGSAAGGRPQAAGGTQQGEERAAAAAWVSQWASLSLTHSLIGCMCVRPPPPPPHALQAAAKVRAELQQQHDFSFRYGPYPPHQAAEGPADPPSPQGGGTSSSRRRVI